MKAYIITGLLFYALQAAAQEGRPWEQYLNEVMTAEDSESETWERTYELLCELEQRPLDINRATREQLEELPFLNAQQVEELVEYLYRYGRMESLGELMMIQSLDYYPRKLLTYFIYIGEEETEKFPKLSNITKYGKHELVGSMKVPFYERKGDKNGYLGYPYRHWMRYQFTYGEYVKLGLAAAQDAGEPFFANQNKWGYDYYSPYLQIRKLGCIETLVLGNYRVSMGMGLVMNNSFNLGKIAMLQNMGRTASGLRAHSSRSAGYLRGVGATINLREDMELTTFVSYSPADATLNKDSTVATILTTDYHRTEKEMEKKHNLLSLKTGGSLRYNNHGLHIGLNTVYCHLDKVLKPNTAVLYRRNYPQGQDFINTSIDYGIVRPRIALNGETAIDKEGHLATINSLSLRLGNEINVMALQRFYSYSYTSLDAQSYSDGGSVQNESGIYLGLTWQPSLSLRLTAYTDYAYFAWAKYQVSQSSYSWDNLLQCVYQHQSWTFGARYRCRIKQRDNEEKNGLTNRTEHRARLTADYSGENGFGSHTQLDGGYGAYEEGKWGAMVSESLSFTHKWLRLNAGTGYFNTDSYDSRLYLYERGLLYSYSMMQFYGEGIRYWLMARAAIGKSLTLTAKVGVTDYFDRDKIGSGYQEIDASSVTDLDVQVRWKF